MIYHTLDRDLNYSTLDIQNNALQICSEFQRGTNYYIHLHTGMRYYFRKEDAIEYIMSIVNNRKSQIKWLEHLNECIMESLKQLEES